VDTVDIKRIKDIGLEISSNINRVIVGKDKVVELILVSVLCEGHILIEDVPGIGKTLLARSLARSLRCTFHRIQCTPDLLPSDITGTYIYNQKNGDFDFRPGPIFGQVILADEINRATPRTQSAFLEAMEEHQVTLEGEAKPLPRPFLLLATQNPIELEGTFPLPEAQLDRFLMRVKIGYPTEAEDEAILERFSRHNPMEELKPVAGAEEILDLQQICRQVLIVPDVRQYIIRLVHATRNQPQIELGASPRAMLSLFRASQAFAAIRGRAFVIPDDVKYLAPYVLTHRIITASSVSLRESDIEDIIHQILNSVPVPVNVGSNIAHNVGA